MTMGRRRKNKVPSIEAIDAYTEQVANDIFIPPINPGETPKFTFVCRLWGRDLFCAVMRGKETDTSAAMLEFIRKQTQQKFKRNITLVIFNCPTWDSVSPIQHYSTLNEQEGGEFDISLPDLNM